MCYNITMKAKSVILMATVGAAASDVANTKGNEVSNPVCLDNEVVYDDSFPACGNGPFMVDYSRGVDIR